MDFVGYGTANCYEGTAACVALLYTTSGSRNNKECIDKNDNFLDFTVGAVNPWNSQTLAWLCSTKKLNITIISPATPQFNQPIDIIVYSVDGSGTRTNLVYATTLSLTSNGNAKLLAALLQVLFLPEKIRL